MVSLLVRVASKRTIESLRYCGWRGYDLSDLEGVTENEVAIEVEHTTWEGEPRPKVAWVHHVSRLTALVHGLRKDVNETAWWLYPRSRASAVGLS